MQSLITELFSSLTLTSVILLMLAALFIGMAKAGLSGLGIAFVPVMALVFGARESTGVVLPMLLAADIMAVIYYHRSAVWKHIIKVLPWAGAGIIIALITGKMINDKQFRIALLSIVWIMLILTLVNDIRQKKGYELPHNNFLSAIMGFTGGFSTMIGNSAGPVFTLYFLSMRLPKKEFIGTSAWLFLILNAGKMPLQVLVWKNITIKTLVPGLMSLPFIALGIYLGIKIVKLLPENFYRYFVIITTLFTSILMFL